MMMMMMIMILFLLLLLLLPSLVSEGGASSWSLVIAFDVIIVMLNVEIACGLGLV